VKIDDDSEMRSGSSTFILSEGGHLGLGYPQLSTGDAICVLFGGKILYIIRASDGHFKFVGERYVHGYMKGEAIDLWRDELSISRLNGLTWGRRQLGRFMGLGLATEGYDIAQPPFVVAEREFKVFVLRYRRGLNIVGLISSIILLLHSHQTVYSNLYPPIAFTLTERYIKH
jgi:hypothetical protein